MRKSELWGGRTNRGLWAATPFLDGSAEDAATEQSETTERQIAERIFDWWISGKAYSVWYAETFLQKKIDFDG